MVFINRLTIANIANPIRAYLHEGGLDLWGNKTSVINSILESDLDRMMPQQIDLQGYKFFMALLWGDKSDRMLDLFGYSGLEKWEANPGIDSWVFKNGLLVPQNGKVTEVTCGEGLVILGREEELRRKTDSLADYVRLYPEIGLPFYRSE